MWFLKATSGQCPPEDHSMSNTNIGAATAEVINYKITLHFNKYSQKNFIIKGQNIY